MFEGILIIQLFLPPSVGIADNADFRRLTAGHGLIANYPEQERYFRYFTPDYLKTAPTDRRGRFYSGSIALRLAEIIGDFKPPGHFDLRWVGFIHMSFFVTIFALLLWVLRGAPMLVKWVVPALAIWIFGDVFYADYLNSLYLDATGFLCFLTVVLAMVAIARNKKKALAALLFVVASIALATSKPLNAPVTAILGIGVAAYGLFLPRRRNWITAAGATATLAGLLMTVATPAYYGYFGLIDAVMIRIVKLPDGPAQLPYFGLTQSDLRFAGEDAFRRDGPGADPGFLGRFSHTTAVKLTVWYALHPGDTAALLRQDLTQYAPNLRPLGDLEKQYVSAGRPKHFSSWSDTEATILRNLPVVFPLVYFLTLVLSGLSVFYRPWRNHAAFGWMLALVAVAGIAQFVSGSLLDAIETSRHLFMFHVTTDVLMLLLFSAGLWRLSAFSR